MVIYNLICNENHEFEGWFPSAAGFDEQVARNQVSCPVCGATAVQRLPHACAVHTKKGETPEPRTRTAPQTQPAPGPDAREMLLRLHRHIRENFEDVGPRFADQARKMFKGEVEQKSIYGTVTTNEREELDSDGVPYIAIPKPLLDS